MPMHAKLKAVNPLPEFVLRAVFQNGEERMYAVMPGLFEQVAIDPSGHAVVWNDKLDPASEKITNEINSK